MITHIIEITIIVIPFLIAVQYIAVISGVCLGIEFDSRIDMIIKFIPLGLYFSWFLMFCRNMYYQFVFLDWRS